MLFVGNCPGNGDGHLSFLRQCRAPLLYHTCILHRLFLSFVFSKSSLIISWWYCFYVLLGISILGGVALLFRRPLHFLGALPYLKTSPLRQQAPWSRAGHCFCRPTGRPVLPPLFLWLSNFCLLVFFRAVNPLPLV